MDPMRSILILFFCLSLPLAEETLTARTPLAKTQQAQGTKARIPALKSEAQALYARKAYVQACKRFEEVTRLAPKDASAFTDLGLCLQKLGRKDSLAAVAANRRALALAVATLVDTVLADHDAQEAEARVRKHAYFNLAKLEAYLPMRTDSALPTPGPSSLRDIGPCSPLPPALGCPHTLHLCVAHGAEGGNRSSSSWEVARVGLSAKDAGFDEGELEPESDVPRPSPPGQGREGDAQPLGLPGDRPANVDLPIGNEEAWDEGGCGQDAGWHCQASEAVFKSARRLCRDDTVNLFSSRCFQDLCDEADGEKRPHRLTAGVRRAIEAEKTRADRAVDECRRRNREMENSSQYDCSLVAADACVGLVGIACRVKDEKGKVRTTVGEYFLKPNPKY
jgi:hypothetical protein